MVEEIGDLYFKVPGEGLVLENNQVAIKPGYITPRLNWEKEKNDLDMK